MSRRERGGAPPPVGMTVATFEVPRWVVRALLALAVWALLMTVAVGVGAVYLFQSKQYLEGRGEFRDAEQERAEEEERLRFCRLFDHFPEGGLLDRARDEFGCEPGNGYPAEQIDPEQREQQRDIYGPSEQPDVPTTQTPREKRDEIERKRELQERVP